MTELVAYIPHSVAIPDEMTRILNLYAVHSEPAPGIAVVRVSPRKWLVAVDDSEGIAIIGFRGRSKAPQLDEIRAAAYVATSARAQREGRTQ